MIVFSRTRLAEGMGASVDVVDSTAYIRDSGQASDRGSMGPVRCEFEERKHLIPRRSLRFMW